MTHIANVSQNTCGIKQPFNVTSSALTFQEQTSRPRPETFQAVSAIAGCNGTKHSDNVYSTVRRSSSQTPRPRLGSPTTPACATAPTLGMLRIHRVFGIALLSHIPTTPPLPTGPVSVCFRTRGIFRQRLALLTAPSFAIQHPTSLPHPAPATQATYGQLFQSRSATQIVRFLMPSTTPLLR